MARAPRLMTNRQAFDFYRRQVESDLRGAADLPADPAVASIMLIAAWSGRYGRRLGVIEGAYGGPGIADRELAERLAARWRARDAARSGTPEWDADFLDTMRMSLSHLRRAGQLDTADPLAPHAFGPSLRSLWLEAAAGGAPRSACVAHVLAWARRPPGVALTKSAEARIARHLACQLRWRETGHPDTPWEAEADGATWRIRLNDFPEAPPYTLLVGGQAAGDFLDWPANWLRGEAVDAPFPGDTSAAPVVLPAEPEAWPRRYAAGEHEQVWEEMVAIGARIREAPFAAPAEAVARETMRRVRHNIGLLLPRLAAEGYRFGRPEAPRGAEPRMLIGGPTPFSMGIGDMLSAVQGVDAARLPGELRGAFGRLMDSLGKAAASPPRAPRTKPQDPLRDADIFQPPPKDAARCLAKLARRGLPLPLSLRFWIEEVGRVDLTGHHPVLCPPASEGGVLPDPLCVIPDSDDVAEQLEDYDPDDDPMELILAYSPADKAVADINATEWDDGIAIDIPKAAADAPLSGGASHPGLVPYLRQAFRNGGFPGWEGRADRPEAEIARVTEGMLPF